MKKNMIYMCILLFLCVCVLLACAGSYVTTQAALFVQRQSSAKAIKHLLQDTSLSSEYRVFFETVNEIKKFAHDDLGLAKGKNFSNFVEVEKNYAALIVQATGELSLEQHMWSYPFVGKLPYRGYFRDEDAHAEARRMREKGFDVTLWGASAFSTLGFFSDPLYSYMMSYSEYELSRVIIHEEVHATVFLKKFSDFNEQCASFIGDMGAYLYMAQKYGATKATEVLSSSAEQESDRTRFSQDMLVLASQLDALYTSTLSDDEKRIEKKRIISSCQAHFLQTYDEHYDSDSFRAFGTSSAVNNAYIALYVLYQEHNTLFQDAYECFTKKEAHINSVYVSDSIIDEIRVFAHFIEVLVSSAKKVQNPWSILEDMCNES